MLFGRIATQVHFAPNIKTPSPKKKDVLPSYSQQEPSLMQVENEGEKMENAFSGTQNGLIYRFVRNTGEINVFFWFENESISGDILGGLKL